MQRDIWILVRKAVGALSAGTAGSEDDVSQTRDYHLVLEDGANTVQCKALFKFLGQTEPNVKVMPKLLTNELPPLLSLFELVILSDPRHLKHVHPVKT